MRAALTVLALWAAGLGAAAQFGKMSFAFDLFAARYPAAGPVGVGLLVSVVGIVGLVFGTTAGLLVARIGPRRAIVVALALGAAMSALQCLPLPYAALFLTRVVEGVSHLSIVVVGPTMIAGIASPRRQGLAMTLWSSFFGVTYALLALVAPPLLAGGSLSALFLGHALWLSVLALVLSALLPPDPPGRTQEMGGILAEHLSIYASPRIAAPATGFVCYTALYVAVLTLLPPLMPPAMQAGVAAGMPLVSILVSLTLGVWLLSRITAVQLVQAGFAVGALAAALLWLCWGQGGPMLAASLTLAAAMGIVQGASFASIPQLNAGAADRARASGAVAQLGNLGTTTGTPLLAWLILHVGPAGVAAFALPLCLLGIAIHGLQSRRRR
ncbi:MFS transporter [Paragemmobacter straminiformis]|uniref:MFS transporter n=1 Tax=Paragemmobacter straminiformis TaxID=2045119 RepID=A0A842I895_9RHOB|nr:MFS transporter [Gemmobacter straminiformis]MBC2835623.1 MFS transporter [Gemmobacter straminiformis]